MLSYGSRAWSLSFHLFNWEEATPNLSRKGECLDNPVAENFFGTLKAQLLGDQPGECFASKAQAVAPVNDYIDNYYNRVRRHST